MPKTKTIYFLISILGISLAVFGILYGAMKGASPLLLSLPGFIFAVIGVSFLLGHQASNTKK
jgi:hypothetical protein